MYAIATGVGGPYIEHMIPRRESILCENVMLDWMISQYVTILRPLLPGAGWTAALCITSAFFAVLIGIFVCLMRMSQNRMLKYGAKWYIDIIRGTPLLLQLFYLYYALPNIGIVMPAFLAGMIGLSMNFGGYLAEVFRSGIQSIDIGQQEAGRSLGLNSIKRMRLIILPQAFRNIYPTLANYALVLIKDSALVAILGVYELMHAGELLANATFEAMKIFTVVGAIYLIMCSAVARLFTIGERNLTIPGYWEAEATSEAMGKG